MELAPRFLGQDLRLGRLPTGARHGSGSLERPITWALAAGFESVQGSSSTWTFADAESCARWGALWADRCELSAFGRQAGSMGFRSKPTE
jgi:hypothetical protein